MTGGLIKTARAWKAFLLFQSALPLFAALPDSLHPGYTLERYLPTDNSAPQVTGMLLLDKTSLLITTYNAFTGGNPRTDGEMILVKGLQSADRKLTLKTVATGLKDVMGITSVDGKIYACDRDRVMQMLDTNGDGVYEGRKTIGTFPAYDGWYEYSFGPLYRDGKFYVGLAAEVQPGGLPKTQKGPGRSTLMEIGMDGKSIAYASGFRAPNGIASGPDGTILMTDNQGGWTPASKLDAVLPGKWYGYVCTPASQFQITDTSKVLDMTHPAAWIPYGDVGFSPTEPVLLKYGRFAGQVVFGDMKTNLLVRVFLESVNGSQQGCVLPFTGGFGGSVNRMIEADDGALYAGLLSYTRTHKYSLQILRPNATEVFEVLAVRSRKDGMEIEFTQPVDPKTLTAAAAKAEQWWYQPTSAYGGPKMDLQTLPVQSVLWSVDNRKVMLTIPGLKEKHVVHIVLPQVANPAGKKILYQDSWYTLNSISLSDPFTTATKMKNAAPKLLVATRVQSGGLSIRVMGKGIYRLTLRDLRGRDRWTQAGQGGEDFRISKTELPQGLYLLTLEEGEARRTTAIAVGF